MHEGHAVALPLDNVDTDQLIPARFMSTPRDQGYGDYLLYDLRRDAAGVLDPAFPLNAARGSVLVAGRNFGSGSSREAAVYALVDAGYRAVLAPAFGDIFAANAVNNGLLPAVLPAAEIKDLMGRCPAPLKIDLQAGRIQGDGQSWPFSLDPVWRTKLINGWDDIDLTASHNQAIAAFRTHRQKNFPWAWPRATG